MAKQELFTKTLKIQKGVNLINDADNSKFPLLLTRILQRLHFTDTDFFTEEEKEKLTSSLSFKIEELELLLATTVFILQQAAHHLCKPALLRSELQKLDINDEKSDAISEAWSNSAKTVVDKLKKKTLLREELSSIKWQLCVNMSSSSQSKLKEPTAIMEFGLKSHLDNDEEFKSLNVEFNHESLYNFYNQLEHIQAHVDSLM